MAKRNNKKSNNAKFSYKDIGYGLAKKSKNGYSAFIKGNDNKFYIIHSYKGKNGKFYFSLQEAIPNDKNNEDVPF